MTQQITIRVLRGADEPAKREEYLQKFQNILSYYGVTRVTSQNKDWYKNTNTWLLIAEDPENDTILAGMRLQMFHPSIKLPAENAVGYKDPKIHDIVNQYANEGIAEFCGLWNSRKLAGFNIGSMYLGIASIAVAPKLGINKMIGLCAPSTKANSFKIGFTIDKRLGTLGEFNYPKENLVATSLFMEDLINLPDADQQIKDKIYHLRNNPNLCTLEDTPKGPILIQYRL